MLPALRSSVRRTYRPQWTVASGSRVQRAHLSTGTRIPRLGQGQGMGRSTWVSLAVGTVTLSAALLLSERIRLDAVEDSEAKPKSKAKERKADSEQGEVASTSQPEKLLQAKEEEARSETSQSPLVTSSEPTDGAEGAEGAEGVQEAGGSNGGAFNPETGEINWDCPCLGGMAHGPCGQEFRDAFSCFVYSEEEPKGINCVEKFKAMQDCFRRHPEVYGEEIMQDDDDDDDGTDTDTDTRSPGLEGKAVPEPDPVAVPPPGIVSPQK